MMTSPLRRKTLPPLPAFRCAPSLLAALFFLLPVISPAATIRTLTVRGNAALTSRQILEWTLSRPGSPYAPGALETDCRMVGDAYRAEGYLGARVHAELAADTDDSARVDVILMIDEGRRTVVGQIRIEGARRLTEAGILERFDLTSGSPLNEKMLERDIDVMLSRYEKIGLPFAQCEIAGMGSRQGAETDSADIVLHVDEGRLMTVDEIRIEGNKETRPSVILRETRLEPGELFNPVKVEAIRQRLNRLNIFSSVAEPTLYVRNDKGGLLLTVAEGNTNTFDGVLGYMPAPVSGGSGYLTGLVSVSMRNLFGTGRKLSLRWQREDQSSQDIGIRYVEPWFLQFPVNLSGGFAQRQQDSTYVRRTFDCGAELMLSEEVSLSLVLNFDRVIPSGDSTAVRAVGSSASTVGLHLAYDSRDDMYSPTGGARYETEFAYGRKRVTAVPAALLGRVDAGGSLQRLSVDADLYIATSLKQVAAFGVHGREVRTGQVQPGEMYRFGGANTLRGYRENEFLGSRIVWTNAEYRFLLARRSYVFGFVDTGYFERPADDVNGTPSAQGFRYGEGIGVRIETGLGIMGVSLALGKGDTFGTAKIHVGLVNEF